MYFEYITCVDLLSQKEGFPVRTTSEDSVYRSRTSSTGSFITKHFVKESAKASEDGLKHFELNEGEKVLLRVFHALRTLSIDIRLYVCLLRFLSNRSGRGS